MSAPAPGTPPSPTPEPEPSCWLCDLPRSHRVHADSDEPGAHGFHLPAPPAPVQGADENAEIRAALVTNAVAYAREGDWRRAFADLCTACGMLSDASGQPVADALARLVAGEPRFSWQPAPAHPGGERPDTAALRGAMDRLILDGHVGLGVLVSRAADWIDATPSGGGQEPV